MPFETIVGDWTTSWFLTLALMAISAILALLLGLPAAMCASVLAAQPIRSTRWARLRGGLLTMWMAGMLFSVATPLILHAAAWESTAGKFGWLMKTMTGGNLLWVGWIHGVHGAAIVAAATYWGTRSLAPEVLQHIAIDFSNGAGWLRVRLSMARSYVIVSAVLVMLIAATEMSVADLHSVRTLADQFYLFYALDPTFTAVAMTTWMPLLIAGGPALVWTWMRSQRPLVLASTPAVSVGRCGGGLGISSSRGWIAWWMALTMLSSLICQGMLILGLVVQAGHSVRIEAGNPRAEWSAAACLNSLASAPRLFGTEYLWTIQLAGLTAMTVVPLALVLARWGRVHPAMGVRIDLFATLAFLIPGPIVGIAVVKLFASGFPGADALATQTLIPTAMAVGVRSGVIAYLILRMGYLQIDPVVWQSARLDGGWIFRVWHVEMPLMWRNLVLALAVAAIVSSGDVPATLPVLPPGVTTVGTRLFGLLHSGSRYQEASLAFWYLSGLIGVGMIGWKSQARMRG